MGTVSQVLMTHDAHQTARGWTRAHRGVEELHVGRAGEGSGHQGAHEERGVAADHVVALVLVQRAKQN